MLNEFDIDPKGNLDTLMEIARLDIWHKYFVGSDLRQLIKRTKDAEDRVEELLEIIDDLIPNTWCSGCHLFHCKHHKTKAQLAWKRLNNLREKNDR